MLCSTINTFASTHSHRLTCLDLPHITIITPKTWLSADKTTFQGVNYSLRRRDACSLCSRSFFSFFNFISPFVLHLLPAVISEELIGFAGTARSGHSDWILIDGQVDGGIVIASSINHCVRFVLSSNNSPPASRVDPRAKGSVHEGIHFLRTVSWQCRLPPTQAE